MENIDKYINLGITILGSLVAVATLITGMTPTPKDDEILSKIRYVFGKLFSFTVHSDASGTFKLPLQDPDKKK